MQPDSHSVEVKEEELNGVFVWLLPLTRRLQDLLDLAERSLFLFIQVFRSDGVAQLWRRGLQISEHRELSREI